MTATDQKYRAIHPSELHLFHKNPRVGDVDAIASSLRANSQYRPIVVNVGTHTGRPMEVLAGNHTLKAFRQLAEKHPDEDRWQAIDCWMLDVDDDRAARIVAADNRTAELGSFDDNVLAGLLSDLPDLEGTGYTDADLQSLLDDMPEPEGQTDPDSAPSVPKDPHSKLGDVWQLGKHRVLCGDSTDVEAVREMMDGDLVDCVWTDPPYGVNYVGKTKDALEIQNDSTGDLEELLNGAFTVAVAVSKAGAPVYVAHADTERIRFETSMLHAGMIVRQNLIWVKNVMVMGRSDYHYKHEPILEGVVPDDESEEDEVETEPIQHEPLLYGFTKGGAGRLGRGGERWYGDNKQTTVFMFDKPTRNGEHPTMKPVDLITAMLSNSCPKNGLVLDLFGGSGSTMIAAHHHGSAARLVELDPRYVDVICRRYQEHTGEVPVLVSTGETHDFVGSDG